MREPNENEYFSNFVHAFSTNTRYGARTVTFAQNYVDSLLLYMASSTPFDDIERNFEISNENRFSWDYQSRHLNRLPLNNHPCSFNSNMERLSIATLSFKNTPSTSPLLIDAQINVDQLIAVYFQNF